MLREVWEATSYLRNINEESEVHTIMSLWLNVCYTRFDIFRERLTFDEVMAEDEVIHANAGVGSSHAIDEPRLSRKRYRRR